MPHLTGLLGTKGRGWGGVGYWKFVLSGVQVGKVKKASSTKTV
jgi:hypothetical protein